MFKKRKIDMSLIDASSKISLKLSCLAACENDIDRAERLYSFLAADIADLPDKEPERPSGFTQVMTGAESVFNWLGQHKQDIMQGVDLVRSLRGPAGATSVPPIPPEL